MEQNLSRTAAHQPLCRLERSDEKFPNDWLISIGYHVRPVGLCFFSRRLHPTFPPNNSAQPDLILIGPLQHLISYSSSCIAKRIASICSSVTPSESFLAVAFLEGF